MLSLTHLHQDLITQMVAIDPATRPTFDTLLHTSRGTVFPECFYSFLHNYVYSVNEVNASAVFSTPQVSLTTPTSTVTSAQRAGGHIGPSSPTLNGNTSGDPLPSDSDHRMERIWADYESVEPYLINESVEQTVMDVKVDYTPQILSSRPFHVSRTRIFVEVRTHVLIGRTTSGAQHPQPGEQVA